MAIKEQIEQTLDEFGITLVKDLIKSLAEKGHGAGSQDAELGGTIKFDVFGKETSIIFQLTMADYWKFVNDGRRAGKRPPASVLDEWQSKNNIDALKIYRSKLKNPSKSKVKFEQARRSLSFAIAQSIAKKGTIKRFGYKGSKFFDSVINDGRLDKLSEQLAEALGREIRIELFETK